MFKRIFHWKYWMEAIRLATFGIVACILLIGIIGFTKSQGHYSQQLQAIKNLSEQNKQLNQQDKQLLIFIESLQVESNNNTNSIHNQINCVLKFFSPQNQANRASSAIADPNQCLIISSSGGATGSTKSA